MEFSSSTVGPISPAMLSAAMTQATMAKARAQAGLLTSRELSRMMTQAIARLSARRSKAVGCPIELKANSANRTSNSRTSHAALSASAWPTTRTDQTGSRSACSTSARVSGGRTRRMIANATSTMAAWNRVDQTSTLARSQSSASPPSRRRLSSVT